MWRFKAHVCLATDGVVYLQGDGWSFIPYHVLWGIPYWVVAGDVAFFTRSEK